jgi:hypothetical protein
MRVERGGPKNWQNDHDTPAMGVVKTSGAGEGVHKHSAGLPDEGACADEDDHEDD